jgi:uncharacterized protein HemX
MSARVSIPKTKNALESLCKILYCKRLKNVYRVTKLKLKDAKAIGRTVAVAILAAVIVIAGVAGYYFYQTQNPPLKDTLIMGTTDSV